MDTVDMVEAEEPKLCTTNGEPVTKVRAEQTEKTGQHKAYIVLCPDERAKGFVRPYRDEYRHIGAKRERCQELWSRDEKPHQCIRPLDHEGDHEFYALMILNGPISFLMPNGCRTTTKMGRALSETYARDPSFYGATFCCACNKHFPVAEFVWTADLRQVGS